MTSNNLISPMKFCYNTNSTLPKQCQSSRSVLKDGSRTFGLFWKEKNPSYNRRNTVCWQCIEKGLQLAGIKVNGYTLRGSNSVIFIVASYINWGHLIKERICSIGANSTFKSRPLLGKLCPPGKQTGSHENCLSLKNGKKI